MLGALLGVVLLLSAACETQPRPPTPRGTVAVKLLSEKKVSELTISDEYMLVVTLPPSDAGHRWEISFHDFRYLQLLRDIHPPADPHAGATVTFMTRTPGRTRLRFVLLPLQASRSVDPIDQQELILTIQ